MKPRRKLLPWFLIAVGLAIPSPVQAEDLYFMTVYGAQRPIVNNPRYAHSWATFIKLSGEGSDPRQYRARSFTISWLPATLVVKPRKVFSEPGVNLTLEQTVEFCAKNRSEIAQFGPYQIKPELWSAALGRFTRLERGELDYRASDLIDPTQEGTTCNCIYAVLDLEGRDPAFRPVTLGFGDIGSAFIVRRLSPFIVNRRQTYPWVSERIGAENYRPAPLAGFISK